MEVVFLYEYLHRCSFPNEKGQAGREGSDGRHHPTCQILLCCRLKCDHPLTEPATRPETIHFWQKMKKMNTGSNASTVMVMKLGQSVEN